MKCSDWRNKYVYNKPVQESYMFYGRRQEVQNILEGYRHGNSYVIMGGHRMGKTSMLLEIERQINALPLEQNTSPKLVPIYLDLVDVQPQKPGDFFQSIIVQLNTKFPGVQNLQIETDDEANDIDKVFDDFITPIKRVADKMRDIRIIILADRAELLLDRDWTLTLTGKLRHLIGYSELREYFVITMSSVINLHEEMRTYSGSPLTNIMDSISLNVFDKEEAQKLIDEPTNGVLPTELRDEIVRVTGGHPFLIQYIMANLDEPPTPEKLHRIIESFPEKRKDFRIWEDSFGALERRILAYLIVKNARVPHRELLRHFRADDIETMDIINAIKKLSYTGIVKGTDKGYETNIPMFTEWYREISLKDVDKRGEEMQEDYVFIIMAMTTDDPYLQDAHQGIKRVCESLNLTAERVDDIEHTGRITDKIIECIKRARFTIADLTHERPNVYYELGYAHGRGSDVILTARKGTKLHFDIKDFNVIFYSNVTELETKLTQRLRALLA